MSRVSILEQLRTPRKSALDFHYDELTAPPIMALFTQQDIQELYNIATSIRYNANIHKKYELIDAVMRRRGFRRAHSGTNRVVYNFLESGDFVAKVAVDRVGIKDSPAEFKNQKYFAPFCCKIFEVDPTGVLAFVERVNPISSLEEFISIADDVFNLMVTKIIGKYVVDDLGTKTYMNFGVRQNSHGHTFGPVIIDFPYVYEVDGAKLICKTPIQTPTGIVPCGGELDYDAGFNTIICTKCGKEYKAMDLAKDDSLVSFMYHDDNKEMLKKIKFQMRAQVIDQGKIIFDSGRSTKQYLSKEEYLLMNSIEIPIGEVKVNKTINQKHQNIRKVREDYYTALQRQYYNELSKKCTFNPVIEPVSNTVPVNKTTKQKPSSNTEEEKKFYYQDEEEVDLTPVKVNRVINIDTDQYGNVVETSDDHIDKLEKATFPEINNKEFTTVDVANSFNNELYEQTDGSNPAEMVTSEHVDKTKDSEQEDDNSLVKPLSQEMADTIKDYMQGNIPQEELDAIDNAIDNSLNDQDDNVKASEGNAITENPMDNVNAPKFVYHHSDDYYTVDNRQSKKINKKKKFKTDKRNRPDDEY